MPRCSSQALGLNQARRDGGRGFEVLRMQGIEAVERWGVRNEERERL